MSNPAPTVEEILRALLTNKHIGLGDQVYTVRENEGLGWDGPSVKAWGAAVVAANEWLKNNPGS